MVIVIWAFASIISAILLGISWGIIIHHGESSFSFRHGTYKYPKIYWIAWSIQFLFVVVFFAFLFPIMK